MKRQALGFGDGEVGIWLPCCPWNPQNPLRGTGSGYVQVEKEFETLDCIHLGMERSTSIGSQLLPLPFLY